MADQFEEGAAAQEGPMMNGHASRPDTAETDDGIELESNPPIHANRSSRESTRLTGTVKWYNAKAGYGFVTRHDTGDDIFVHFSGITRKNPRQAMKSLGDGELVEFNLSATNVTGPGGRPVRGNPYVSYLTERRNDSFASGDPATFAPPPRYYSTMNTGNSRIPRYVPNWRR